MGVSRQLQAVVTAAQFLTRVPLPGGTNRPDPDLSLLRAAVVYFPLVGAAVGLFTGGLVWAAGHLWPVPLAVLLGLAAEARLTGGFHEDAVADCCDAFGGGWTRDDVLRILKDSRVGSFGALGLLLAVLVRAGGLAAVPAGLLVPAAVASAAAGRWAILLMMWRVPPVPHREGLSKDVGQQLGGRELLAGTLLAVPGVGWCLWLDPVRTAAGLAAVAGWAWLWAGWVDRRLGGVTGDCLGCGCYIGQCLVLLAVAAGR